jgi:hypothetical protein
MFVNLHPKCANPSCAAAFGWMTGGRLFRFHREAGHPEEANRKPGKRNEKRAMEHFWLCERCANLYTLQYQPGQGIKILSLWPQLPAAENNMHLPSA